MKVLLVIGVVALSLVSEALVHHDQAENLYAGHSHSINAGHAQSHYDGHAHSHFAGHVAVTRAHSDGLYHQAHAHHDEHHDYYAPPHYDFVYKVEDGHTGDVKSHHEERVGDQVKGVYMQHQPDGTILEVHYTADKHGYNAKIQKLGKSIHPEPEYHHHAPHHH